MKIITDDRGRLTDREFDDYGRVPAPASVVLVGGAHGNAYQLYASDGLWHRAREARTWEDMLTERNLVLVYDAPVREPKPGLIRVIPLDSDGAPVGNSFEVRGTMTGRMPRTEPEQVDYCVVHQVVHYDGHASGSCKITKKWTGLPPGAQGSLS